MPLDREQHYWCHKMSCLLILAMQTTIWLIGINICIWLVGCILQWNEHISKNMCVW
jgi:hypothetical protein